MRLNEKSENFKKHEIYKGFTLAEVLITLGIIGIVAAMTLPALITNYQKKVTAARVKKAYSELNQAFKLSEIENGSYEYWTIPRQYSVEENKEFVSKYIAPYYTDLKLCSVGYDYTCGFPVSGMGANCTIPNGTGISIIAVAGTINFVIDVNGAKKPNRMGTDYFIFTISQTDNKGKLLPNSWFEGITREDALNGYTYNSQPYKCSTVEKDSDDNTIKTLRHACTALLMLDNWEFKKDYPW